MRLRLESFRAELMVNAMASAKAAKLGSQDNFGSLSEKCLS